MGLPFRFYFPDKASFKGVLRRGNARIYSFVAQDFSSLGLIHEQIMESLEYQRIAESYFQHTESTFSSDNRQSMKRRIIAKHLTDPK